jgi:hypothetical protein
MQKNNFSRNKSKYTFGKWIVLLIVLLVAVMATLELTNTTHIFHRQRIPAVISVTNTKTKNNNSNKNTITTNSGTSQATTTPTKVTSSAGETTSSSQPLESPYGSFVSNHYPGQNGSNLDEVSVCNTTPGASCYIKFSNGSITTQLPTQVTNNAGVTSWTWNIGSDAHLTSGQWQITAVASLNGQFLYTNDPMMMIVQ